MERFFLCLWSFIIMAILLPVNALARDFTYTYEGQTLTYTVLDEEAKTCETKQGHVEQRGFGTLWTEYVHVPGNRVSNELRIPKIVNDGDVEYVVKKIGRLSFYGSQSLTSIIIPNSVTSIDYEAFSECTGLTSVTIPNSVISIDRSFSGCTGLKYFTVEDGETQISLGDFSDTPIENLYLGRTWTYSSWSQELKSITIGDMVREIPAKAFYKCSSLTELTIGNSVTSIGKSAFFECTGLTSITLPNSITSINSEIFSGCTGLTSITLPISITSIGSGAFSGCTGLTSVSIPNSVTSIGSGAFSGCTGLSSMTIPNSVTLIGYKAFSGCTGLTSMTIPNSVNSIGSDAFSGCTGLKDFTVEEGETPIEIDFSDTPIENLYMGRSWTGTDYYYSPQELKSLTIGNLVKNIPEKAFYNCTGLITVTIPNSVTSIGDYAFNGCTGLITVTIPNSVTSIGDYAFNGCTGLTAVTIPNSVTSIGNYAFSNINQLESVTIPISVKEMGANILHGSGVDMLNLYSKSAIYLYNLKYINHLVVNKDATVCFHQNSGYGLYKLQDFIKVQVSSTQTTASFTFYPEKTKTIKIVDNSGNEVKFQNAVTIPSTFDYKWDGNTVKYSNLSPCSYYGFNLLGVDYGTHTKEISINLTSENFADKVRATASFDSGDYSVMDYYWGYEDTHALTVDIPWEANLKSVNFNVAGRDNYRINKSLNLSYPDPKFSDAEAVATALDKARLTANCNLSNGAVAGIEWRRNDAPDDVKSNEAKCPVVAGQMMGELKGLRDNVYYKFRPYYERGDKKYYGEWVGFYTGDAGVYFEPEVGTLDATVSTNAVRLEGYAYAGTDNISSAGFEYRVADMGTRAEEDWQTVEAAANTYLRASLEGLLAETKYEYRAFAVAGGKTYYGASDVFTTPADPAGIDEIEAADGSTLEAVLLRNPVIGAPQVKVQSEEGSVRCYIHSIDGSLIYSGDVIADGNIRTIDVRLNGGIYILNLVGKDGRATFRMLSK